MGDLRVEIVDGVLSRFKADVIINSTVRSLKLNIGVLSKAILTAAGEDIQHECNKKYPNGIDDRTIAITAGYKLQCKKVYHCALIAWDDKKEGVDPQQVLCDLFCSCLDQAHKDKATSLALPTLGCGFLNYPHKVVAMTIAQCIAMYKSQHENTPLKVIYIVIYARGRDWRHIKQAFQQELGIARGNRSGPRITRKAKQNPTKAPPFARPRHTVEAVNNTKPAQTNNPLQDTCQREQANNSCQKVLICGHICGGVRNERDCPPCLQNDCNGHGGLTQEANDDCTICFTDTLVAAPVIKLKCGHLFHFHCAKRILDNKWVEARITFSFMKCPICKENIEHSLLQENLTPLKALRDSVQRKAMMRLQYEEKDNSDEITDKDSPYYRKPELFAMEKYCYYPCFICKDAYFGGEVLCDQAAGGVSFKAKNLICPACANPDPSQVCEEHGIDFLEYKCCYCCSIAVYFCHGTTHFCNECHDNYGWWDDMDDEGNLPQCPAGPSGRKLKGRCPLNVKHPPTGEEFSLGCGICKNTQSF